MADSARGPNELRAGAVLSYLVIGLQFLVAMLYTPIMLRLLGQAEYGLYSLVGSIVSYLALLSFGFGGAYMRFYSRLSVVEDWDGVRRLNGLFLTVFTAIGLVAAAGGTLLTLNVDAVLGSQFSGEELDTARVLFSILVVNLAITFPSSVFNSYVTAHERFIFQKLLSMARVIVSPLVVLPVLLLGYQSIGMAVATTAVNIAFTLRTVVYARSTLGMRFTFRSLDLSLLREISVFSSYLFLNMVVDQINWNVDKFIIGRFHGAVPVAIYGVAAMLNAHYLTFSTAISSVFIPRINTMVASGRSDVEISDLFTRVARIQFFVLGMVLTGFIFLGRTFIALWAGEDYGEAYIVALFLMVPVTLSLTQTTGIEIQRAKNLHQFRSWTYFAIAIGNIALSVPLTREFGAKGAAFATGLAIIIGPVVLMNWYYQARVGIDIKRFWSELARMSLGMVPAVLTGLIIVTWVDLTQVWSLVCSGLVYVATYVIGMWVFGFNAYERRLVGSSWKKIVRWRRSSES